MTCYRPDSSLGYSLCFKNTLDPYYQVGILVFEIRFKVEAIYNTTIQINSLVLTLFASVVNLKSN